MYLIDILYLNGKFLVSPLHLPLRDDMQTHMYGFSKSALIFYFIYIYIYILGISEERKTSCVVWAGEGRTMPDSQIPISIHATLKTFRPSRLVIPGDFLFGDDVLTGERRKQLLLSPCDTTRHI